MHQLKTPQLKQRNDVDSQMTSLKETSLKNQEPLRNSSEKMKLVADKYCASITPTTFKTKPKKRLTASQLKYNGDDNIFSSHNSNFIAVWETLVRGETWMSDELHISVSSIIVIEKCICLRISEII